MKRANDNMGYLLVGFSVALLLLLIFIKSDVDKEQEVLCNTFHEYGLDMSTCPAHNSNTSWLLTISFGISFMIFGLGAYMSFMPSEIKQAQKKIDVDTSEFDAEENQLFKIIEEANGSTYQTDLIKKTGFSKVKVTRVLDRLESKGILERKRRGMTNLIVIK